MERVGVRNKDRSAQREGRGLLATSRPPIRKTWVLPHLPSTALHPLTSDPSEGLEDLAVRDGGRGLGVVPASQDISPVDERLAVGEADFPSKVRERGERGEVQTTGGKEEDESEIEM